MPEWLAVLAVPGRGRPARLPRPGPPDPRGPAVSPGQRFRPSVPAGRDSGARRGPGVRQARHQRIPQRQVQVHRPGKAPVRPGRRRPRVAGQRPPVGIHPRAGLRHPGLGEPADRPAVEFQLVNGLVGAGAAQLGRPVGGQHQQRDAGLVRLDHRGVEVGRRRPRGADHRDRPPAGLGQPQGQERRRPLINPHMQAQPARGRALLPQRDGQGRAARAGGQHGLPQAAAHQLVNQGDGEGSRGIHGAHWPGQASPAGAAAPRNPAAATTRARQGSGSADHDRIVCGSAGGRRTGR